MRAVVLGGQGQLGRSLSARLPHSLCLARGDLDITDVAAVDAFGWAGHDVIINAAGYTSVDHAESPAGRRAAWRVNAAGVANLARAARDTGRTLVQVSTEYVFDGHARHAMPESWPVAPLNVYGASKAAGELAATACPSHYVIRSSWLAGDGTNFVRTMVRLAAQGSEPAVVDDQLGRPTFTDDLASAIGTLVASRAPFGTYHVTNDGDAVSWAGLARAVFALAGRAPADIREVSTEEYRAARPDSAWRPSNGVLDLGKAARAGIRLPEWRGSLAAYVETELTRG